MSHYTASQPDKIENKFSMDLRIDDLEYRKVMHWVRKVDHEVSGFGVVRRDTDGVLRVVKVIMLTQKGTAIDTEIDGADLAKACFDLKDEGGPRWWWHSHAKMSVYWSRTDDEALALLQKHGWFTATVFNHEAAHKSLYVQGQPQSFRFDMNLKRVVGPEDPALVKTWDEEFERNVKKPEAFKSTTYNNAYNPYVPPKHETRVVKSTAGGRDHRDFLQEALWSKWQCPDCKTKNIEDTPFNVLEVVLCTSCDRTYQVKPGGDSFILSEVRYEDQRDLLHEAHAHVD